MIVQIRECGLEKWDWVLLDEDERPIRYLAICPKFHRTAEDARDAWLVVRHLCDVVVEVWNRDDLEGKTLEAIEVTND